MAFHRGKFLKSGLKPKRGDIELRKDKPLRGADVKTGGPSYGGLFGGATNDLIQSGGIGDEANPETGMTTSGNPWDPHTPTYNPAGDFSWMSGGQGAGQSIERTGLGESQGAALQLLGQQDRIASMQAALVPAAGGAAQRDIEAIGSARQAAAGAQGDIDQAENLVAGGGPSIAKAQLAAGNAQAMSTANAGASAGAGDSPQARRAAMMAGARTLGALGGEAAGARSQEQLGALKMTGAAREGQGQLLEGATRLGGAANQAVGAAGNIATGLAGARTAAIGAGADLTTQNAGTTLNMAGEDLSTIEAQQNAYEAERGREVSRESIDAGVQLAQRQLAQQQTGAIINAVGGAVTAGAQASRGSGGANNQPNNSSNQAADMHLDEPEGQAHWIIREEPDFLLAHNARTGESRKLLTAPLSPDEHSQAFGRPHGAGPIGSHHPDNLYVHDATLRPPPPTNAPGTGGTQHGAAPATPGENVDPITGRVEVPTASGGQLYGNAVPGSINYNGSNDPSKWTLNAPMVGGISPRNTGTGGQYGYFAAPAEGAQPGVRDSVAMLGRLGTAAQGQANIDRGEGAILTGLAGTGVTAQDAVAADAARSAAGYGRTIGETQAIAAGRGPSFGTQLIDQQTQQNIANQNAQAASATGPGAALARRQAQQAAGAITQQAGGQARIAQATEQLGAMNELPGLRAKQGAAFGVQGQAEAGAASARAGQGAIATGLANQTTGALNQVGAIGGATTNIGSAERGLGLRTREDVASAQANAAQRSLQEYGISQGVGVANQQLAFQNTQNLANLGGSALTAAGSIGRNTGGAGGGGGGGGGGQITTTDPYGTGDTSGGGTQSDFTNGSGDYSYGGADVHLGRQDHLAQGVLSIPGVGPPGVTVPGVRGVDVGPQVPKFAPTSFADHVRRAHAGLYKQQSGADVSLGGPAVSDTYDKSRGGGGPGGADPIGIPDWYATPDDTVGTGARAYNALEPGDEGVIRYESEMGADLDRTRKNLSSTGEQFGGGGYGLSSNLAGLQSGTGYNENLAEEAKYKAAAQNVNAAASASGGDYVRMTPEQVKREVLTKPLARNVELPDVEPRAPSARTVVIDEKGNAVMAPTTISGSTPKPKPPEPSKKIKKLTKPGQRQTYAADAHLTPMARKFASRPSSRGAYA